MKLVYYPPPKIGNKYITKNGEILITNQMDDVFEIETIYVGNLFGVKETLSVRLVQKLVAEGWWLKID